MDHRIYGTEEDKTNETQLCCVTGLYLHTSIGRRKRDDRHIRGASWVSTEEY